MLEFLPELFDTLRDEGHSLTESEAAIFFPCLIEKVLFLIWWHGYGGIFIFHHSSKWLEDFSWFSGFPLGLTEMLKFFFIFYFLAARS